MHNRLPETKHTICNYSNLLQLCGFAHLQLHFPLFSLRVMCLFMQTERKYVNSFENARRKCENGTFDMALSCKCLQIPLWSLCGQHIPRTECGVGGRKGTVQLFMNCILSFPAEFISDLVEQWGGGRARPPPLRRKHRHKELPMPNGLEAAMRRERGPLPTPCPHRACALLGSGCWPALPSLMQMYHLQPFKRRVTPSQ